MATAFPAKRPPRPAASSGAHSPATPSSRATAPRPTDSHPNPLPNPLPNLLSPPALHQTTNQYFPPFSRAQPKTVKQRTNAFSHSPAPNRKTPLHAQTPSPISPAPNWKPPDRARPPFSKSLFPTAIHQSANATLPTISSRISVWSLTGRSVGLPLSISPPCFGLRQSTLQPFSCREQNDLSRTPVQHQDGCRRRLSIRQTRRPKPAQSFWCLFLQRHVFL